MFELAMPWVLVLLPLPWLIWFLAPRAPLSMPAALRVPFFQAVLGLVDTEKQQRFKQRDLWLVWSVWVLLLVALSGPRWVGKALPLEHEGYNIMLVLDISGSMELTDRLLHGRPVSRLTVVKRTAEQFVRERKGDRFGLILFGSRAYLQTPLTYDRNNVLMRLDDASVGLAGKTTSIGDALGLAVKRLQNVSSKGRIIILLTDGANNSGVLEPTKAAELAQDDGIKVYTIGLGSDGRAVSMNGMFLNLSGAADLDEVTLQNIAKITGGRYFRATDLASLQEIYHTINRLEKTKQVQQTIRPQRDYYPYPLMLALLLWLYFLLKKSGLWQSYYLRSIGDKP